MQKNKSCVDILMATFNGEKYLCEQIESIINQDYQQWNLIIHDDGSTDKTKSILNYYKKKYPLKISTIDDNLVTGSAKKNFFHLLKHTNAEYVMLADQDDFWLPQKISSSLKKLQEIEASKGKDHPIMVYTDLIIVDENLKTLSNSMKKFHGFQHPKKIEDIALRNNVTGCTIIFNNSLLEKLEFPNEAIMHDWWIAIDLFRNNGTLEFLEESTILYRQHEKNTIGAKNKNSYISVFSKFIKNPYIYFIYFHKIFIQFRFATGKGIGYFIVKKIFTL